MALQAHQVEPAQEALLIHLPRQPRCLQASPVVQGPAAHPGRGPTHIAVAQQGHQVVGDRPRYRVLEIDDRQGAVRLGHQVAAVEIPVHQHLRLLQGTGHQQRVQLVQQAALLFIRGVPQQGLCKPGGEAAQLLLQQGGIVVGNIQAGGIYRRHAQQHIHGPPVSGVDRPGGQFRQQQAITQILEQQVAALQIRPVQRRNPHAGPRQQCPHSEKFGVFFRTGGCLDQDAGVAAESGAKITPVAGIPCHRLRVGIGVAGIQRQLSQRPGQQFVWRRTRVHSSLQSDILRTRASRCFRIRVYSANVPSHQ